MYPRILFVGNTNFGEWLCLYFVSFTTEKQETRLSVGAVQMLLATRCLEDWLILFYSLSTGVRNQLLLANTTSETLLTNTSIIRTSFYYGQLVLKRRNFIQHGTPPWYVCNGPVIPLASVLKRFNWGWFHYQCKDFILFRGMLYYLTVSVAKSSYNHNLRSCRFLV